MTTEHHHLCDDDGWDHPGDCVIETSWEPVWPAPLITDPHAIAQPIIGPRPWRVEHGGQADSGRHLPSMVACSSLASAEQEVRRIALEQRSASFRMALRYGPCRYL